MQRSPVTIIDVAARAGVSKSTVSNVLAGRASVDAELASRVRAAIDDLDYTPSAVARGLVQRRTRTIGVVAPDLGNPFYGAVLRGAEVAATRAGYRILIASSAFGQRSEVDVARELMEHRPEAFLLCAVGDPGAVRAVVEAGYPTVVVDTALEETVGVGVIGVDEELGIVLAMRHLVGLGHRRIAALLESDEPGGDRPARVAGYRAALGAAGLPFDDALLLRDRRVPGSNEPAPRPGVARALVALEPRPTAILVYDDLVAVGVIDSLEARGLLVPADVSVVGFSDLPIAGAARIGLTTIRQDATAMGETAVAALVDRLSDPDRGRAPDHHVFEPVLVVRSTTGPPP